MSLFHRESGPAPAEDQTEFTNKYSELERHAEQLIGAQNGLEATRAGLDEAKAEGDEESVQKNLDRLTANQAKLDKVDRGANRAADQVEISQVQTDEFRQRLADGQVSSEELSRRREMLLKTGQDTAELDRLIDAQASSLDQAA